MEPKKTKQADLENKKSVFFMAGLLIALAFVLVAFEWRQYEEAVSLGELNIEIEEEIIPITQQNEPPPPPPPPPAAPEILNIVETEEEVEEELDMEDTEANEKTVVDIVFEEEAEEEEQIFVSVENMPSFPGCENLPDNAQRMACTQKKMAEHLGKNIKYPQMMKDAGIEGTVYVTFVFDKTGKVTDIQVMRGVSGGKALDQEAIRAIGTLPKMSPGTQRGKPVPVRFTWPVKFTIKS